MYDIMQFCQFREKLKDYLSVTENVKNHFSKKP